MEGQRPIVLASGSPRRRELLGLTGFVFERLSLDIDETVLPAEAPGAYTLRVSRQKAQAARQHVQPGTVVIAADTTVADGDSILGKPVDAADAEAMLKQLRERAHQVYTAVTVFDTASNEIQQDLASTNVVMRDYTDTEIAAYIASGDPFDKAGAYAIQNREFDPVASIVGCYANVVGLPICHLVRVLREFGIVPSEDVPSTCQQFNHIECPVHAEILSQTLDNR